MGGGILVGHNILLFMLCTYEICENLILIETLKICGCFLLATISVSDFARPAIRGDSVGERDGETALVGYLISLFKGTVFTV